jgi:uncharacterized OB-fold protein
MSAPLAPFEDLGLARAAHLLQQSGVASLRGGQCRACQRRFFPLMASCPYCSAAAPEAVALAREGTLYTYTTVHVSSSRPTPYDLGYVDLEAGVRVLAPLTAGTTPWRPDLPVRLQVAAEGEWSFAPLESAHD